MSLLLAFLVGMSFSPATAQDLRCEQGPPDSAYPYDPHQPEALAGSFEVLLVVTSWAEPFPYSVTLSLEVASADQMAEALQEGIGRMPRPITHAGSFERDGYSFPAEANGALIYLGCVACLDASPDHLFVAAVDETGLWGVWRDFQTGIGAFFDEDGNRLPDPAGYFCARRVGGVKQSGS